MNPNAAGLERVAEDPSVLVARVVDAVDRALAAELAGDGLLLAAARHLALAGGAKRVRPRVCALFGAIAGAPERAIADAATVVEMIHTASLLHDDVVDVGLTRRGAPTVNARFGADVAVLVGDHLLSRAVARLAPHPRALTTRTVEVVAEMSRAAIVEVEARGRVDLGPAAWRAMAEGKTGALFGLAGYAAGVLAGDEARAARLESVGRAFGIAFQLRDDVDDLLEQGVNDLVERNPSWVVLDAAARDADLRAALTALWSVPVVDASAARSLGARIATSGAVQRALAGVDAELHLARAVLAGEPRPDATREILRAAEQLAVRTTEKAA